MKIWAFSDLHIDVHPWSPPEHPPEHDVIVIAGDVQEKLVKRVLPWLREHFRDKPVIYVPGNHDFYRGRNIEREIELATYQYGNLHVLSEGQSIVIDRTRFIGATLWTDYNLVPELQWQAANEALLRMNDHSRIRIGASYRKWMPGDAGAAHVRHRQAISEALAAHHDGPPVVVTHHAPHPNSLRGGTWREGLDGAYASDLTELLESPSAPVLWLHGHIHENRDYVVGRTRIVCNPRGYVLRERTGPWVENPAFDPRLVLDV
jgi:Icc-related predicted phosphoesterase